ncbi:MAG: FHA domain-containing protein, partial [Pirellulaceae bacterium]|nr:FHA domain-containing protein [Pirellulaceae bacterium]
MPDLIAIGKGPDHRWRMEIPEGETVRLGRAPRTGWSVTWDDQVSREHADLRLVDGLLRVTCLGTAKNPILKNGVSVQEFEVQSGGSFQIGQTIFRFIDDS